MQNLKLQSNRRTEPVSPSGDSGAPSAKCSLISPEKPGERPMLSSYVAAYERVTHVFHGLRTSSGPLEIAMKQFLFLLLVFFPPYDNH